MKKTLNTILTDAMAVTGASAISYGAWLIDPTAGIITCGVILLVAALGRGYGENRS